MRGLLWMDDSDVPFEAKVREAAKRYRSRFGRAATCCYVNRAASPEPRTVGRVAVMPRENILPHHFFAGREEPDESTARPAA